MNEAVFKAIGELLKEQQDLTTEQIKKIEDDVFEQITLVKLKEGTPGAPGEDGKDADPEAVAEIIVEKYADTLKGEAGRDGQDGQDGRDVSVEEILNHAKSDDDFLDSIKATDGQDGAPGVPGADGRDGLGIETKAFSAGEVYREGSYVTSHFGQTFKALRDTVNDVDSQDWERVGSGGFRFTGPVSKDFDYQDGDLFVKDFGLFLVVKGENKLVAGRGPRGEKGEKGISGVDGRDGSQVEEVDLIDGSLVILSKDHEGNFSKKSVELTPILDMVAHIANDSVTAELELMPDIVKSIIDRTLTAHVDDPQAIPMRFFRGPWQGTDSYQTGDVVSYGMAIYIALNSSSGIIPEGGILNRQDAKKHWRMIISTVIPELLTKPRADQLYSIMPWSQKDWEKNSVVRLGGRIYKAEAQALDKNAIGPNPNSAPLSIEVTSLGDHTAPKIIEVHGGPVMAFGNLGLDFDFSLGGKYSLAFSVTKGETAAEVASNILSHYAHGFSKASLVDPQTIMISPGAADMGSDLTFIPQTRMPADAGTPVKIKVSGGPVNSSGTLDFDFRDSKGGDDVQTISLKRGMDTDAVIDAILKDWSNSTTTVTKDSAFEFTITPNAASGDVQEFSPNAISLAAINLSNSVSPIELNSISQFGGTDYNIEPSLWTDITPKIRMNELNGASELIKASDGQVPMWSAKNQRWEPKDIVAPITYLGSQPWDGGDVLSTQNFYGMDQNTVPDPTVWHPRPGDTYISLATGQITILQGPGGTVHSDASPIQRHANMITTGTSPAGLDAIRNNLGELDDVDLRNFRPADGDTLQYDAANDVWKPAGPGGGSAYEQVLYQGSKPFDLTKKNDGITYGMAAGTVPNPASLPPKAGDIYVSSFDHIITNFITGHSDDVNRQSIMLEIRKHLSTYQGWKGDTAHHGEQMFVNAFLQGNEIDINQSVKPDRSRFIIDIEGQGKWTDHTHAADTHITLSVRSAYGGRVPNKYHSARIDFHWPGGAGKTVDDYANFVKAEIDADPVWSTLFTVSRVNAQYLWLTSVDCVDLVNDGTPRQPTMLVSAPWTDNQGREQFTPDRNGVSDYLKGQISGSIVAVDGTSAPMNVVENVGRTVITVPNNVPDTSHFEITMHGTKYVVPAQRDIQVEQENWDRGSEGGVMQLDHSDNVWKVEKMPYFDEKTWLDARPVIPGQQGDLYFPLKDSRRPAKDYIELNGFIKPTQAGTKLLLKFEVELDLGSGTIVLNCLDKASAGTLAYASVIASASVTSYDTSNGSGNGQNTHHSNYGAAMHKTETAFNPHVALPFNVQVRAYNMENKYWTVQWSAVYTSENNTPMTVTGYQEVDFSPAINTGVPTTIKSFGISSDNGSKLDGRMTATWH